MGNLLSKEINLKSITAIKDKHESLFICLFIVLTYTLSRVIMGVFFAPYTKALSFTEFCHSINVYDSEWFKMYINCILDKFLYVDLNNGQAVWGFFPLMPLIVSFFWYLTRFKADVYVVGFFINSVFFMVSEYFAYKYIILTRKKLDVAVFYILFMTFGLYTFYFSILYSESLFLCLLTMCFYYLKRKKYLTVGILGALLSLTRHTGVIFVFTILVSLIVDYKDDATVLRKNPFDFVLRAVKNPHLVLGTCLVPLGLFSYMLFLLNYVNDGLAFVTVVCTWGRNVDNYPFEQFFDEFCGEFPPSFLSVALVIVLFIICYGVFDGKRYEEMIGPVITIILCASTVLMSVPRVMIGCFTIVLTFTDMYCKLSKSSKVFIGVVVLLLEGVLFREWILLHPDLC